MAVEARTIENRETWLGWRKQDVTASAVGALFGVHPYTTALRLYVEKRGVEFPVDESTVMRRGRWLEPAVAEAVRERRPQWTISPAKTYFRDPDLKLGATPDFFIDGDPRGRGILQAKTIAPSVYARDWCNGEEVPMWIVLQAATEMMLADARFAVIAGLLVDPHRMDVVIHEIPRNSAAEAKIAAAAREFWQRVANGQEPEPDYGKDADVIKAMHPAETPGRMLDANGDNRLPLILDERVTLQTHVKECEARIEEIDAEIKHKMADAELITGLPGWRVSFKTTDRAGYTVAPKKVRSLRVYDKREPTAAATE